MSTNKFPFFDKISSEKEISKIARGGVDGVIFADAIY
jgi:hypothetical protein